MKPIFFLLFFWSLSFLQAQHQISGKVTDRNGQPIVGANVYMEGSYDGATTSSMGEFSFHTSLKGEQTLVISYVSFETARRKIQVTAMQDLWIKLRRM